MEFKKCARCGAFFVTDNNVCSRCEPRDKAEIYKLASYISENEEIKSMADLSIQTDITTNNLNRFIQSDDISNAIAAMEDKFPL